MSFSFFKDCFTSYTSFCSGNINGDLEAISRYSTCWGLGYSVNHLFTTASTVLAIASGARPEDDGLETAQIVLMSISFFADALITSFRTNSLFKARIEYQKQIRENKKSILNVFEGLISNDRTTISEEQREKIMDYVMFALDADNDYLNFQIIINKIESCSELSNIAKNKIIKSIYLNKEAYFELNEAQRSILEKLSEKIRRIALDSTDEVMVRMRRIFVYQGEDLESHLSELDNIPGIDEKKKKEIIGVIKSGWNTYFQRKSFFLPVLGLLSGVGLAISGGVIKQGLIRTILLGAAPVASDLFATLHNNIIDKEVDEINAGIKTKKEIQALSYGEQMKVGIAAQLQIRRGDVEAQSGMDRDIEESRQLIAPLRWGKRK